jgi:hypothetical protein
VNDLNMTTESDPVQPTGRNYDHYNPVDIRVQEATGAVFLGILAFILLIALLRLQQQNRALLAQLAERP